MHIIGLDPANGPSVTVTYASSSSMMSVSWPHSRMRPIEVVWRREPDYAANHEKRLLIAELRDDLLRERS